MLVVTRKAGEVLMIGEDVEIKVVAVGKDFVRLGITAPRDISVHRQEVFLAVQRSKSKTEEEMKLE